MVPGACTTGERAPFLALHATDKRAIRPVQLLSRQSLYALGCIGSRAGGDRVVVGVDPPALDGAFPTGPGAGVAATGGKRGSS